MSAPVKIEDATGSPGNPIAIRQTRKRVRVQFKFAPVENQAGGVR